MWTVVNSPNCMTVCGVTEHQAYHRRRDSYVGEVHKGWYFRIVSMNLATLIQYSGFFIPRDEYPFLDRLDGVL